MGRKIILAAWIDTQGEKEGQKMKQSKAKAEKAALVARRRNGVSGVDGKRRGWPRQMGMSN